MYVCICNAVTEKEVRQAASDGARSLQDLQCGLGVATGCGQCAGDACSLLESAAQAAPISINHHRAATGRTR